MQSVLPYYVATKMSKIRKPTFSKPSPETYVRAALGTVGLQSRTNGCIPHALIVSHLGKRKDLECPLSVCYGRVRIILNTNYLCCLTSNYNLVMCVTVRYPLVQAMKS